MSFENKFDPLWVPILTHYKSKNKLELDNSLIEKHIKWLKPHVTQYLVCGTTGDGWNLNEKLVLDWLDLISQEHIINKNNKILFGVFGSTTKDVLNRAELVENYIRKNKCHASYFGLTLCAPVGEKISQQDIIRHFETIIKNTKLPISIYQLPQVVKCTIEPESLKTLKEKYQTRIDLFKDTSGEDKVINSKLDFGNIKFLRGAEENYYEHLSPKGKYDGFLLSSANCFAKILREICNKDDKHFSNKKNLSNDLSNLIKTSFEEGQKLDFGNPFSNVNKAFIHVLLNDENLYCKTCFDKYIPGNFLIYAKHQLTNNNLSKSLFDFN